MTSSFDGKLRYNQTSDFEEAYLPSQNPQNHASNLLELANGDLLCAWFSGTQEGVSDISIYLARLPKGESQWSIPIKISNDPSRSEQNPVLFEEPDSKRVWILYTAQKFGNQDTAIVRYRTSEDCGYTWSEIQTLIDEPGTFIRQPILILKDSAWVLPIFHCATPRGKKWVGDYDTAAVKVSRDKGRTWQEFPVPDSVGCVHMCINFLPDGRLVALYRSRWADAIYRSESADGMHWSAPQITSLPNNNSSIQATTLADGRLAIVFNNISAKESSDRRASLYDEIEEGVVREEEKNHAVAIPVDAQERKAIWGVPRAPLSLAISSDGGKTWPLLRNIQEGDGNCLSNNSREKKNRELSYPSIKQGKDGSLHVSYTYYRQTIKYVHLAKDWVSKK